MKNSIAIAALSVFFVFSACKKSEPKDQVNEKAEIKKSETFIVDSVKVKDSVKITDSLSVNYSSNLLVFLPYRMKIY